MCEDYVDEVMTAPSHLKNGNYLQMVSTISGTFLNYIATINDKQIAIRKLYSIFRSKVFTEIQNFNAK